MNTPTDATTEYGVPYKVVYEGQQQTIRRQMLEEAASLVDGDRNIQYGDPNDDFLKTSSYWSTHAGGVLRRKLHDAGLKVDDEVMQIVNNLFDPHDVAIMMIQLKIARLAWSPQVKDHWVDSAGYAACGLDCASD